MAETQLYDYTVQERLNKMIVDVIDITVKPDADNGADMAVGDFMFPLVEIPNAVPVPGGTAILQSCCAIIHGGDNDGLDTGSFNIVITSDSTTLQHAGADIHTDDLDKIKNTKEKQMELAVSIVKLKRENYVILKTLLFRRVLII